MTSALDIAMEEFFGETTEMMERITLNLALVERQEHSKDTIHSIYRDIHSVKGAAQLFGCQQMGQLAHSMETCLDPIRNGLMVLHPEFVDALYQGIDVIKVLLESLRRDRKEQDVSAELIKVIPKLTELTVRGLEGDTKSFRDVHGVPENVSQASQQLVEHVSESKSQIPVQVQGKPQVQVQDVARAATPTPKGDVRADENVAKDKGAVENVGNETIRVNVALLDNLMNLVGELVLIRNQMLQYSKNVVGVTAESQNLSQRLNIVTTELQNDVMKTRMQPIGNILTKFNRVVRDLARDLGKSIELVLEGTDTELDKTLIEAVRDPLMHIVRNAVDHGIELPDVRQKAQKLPTGTIKIRSFHEGGQVIIEVSDDGKGLSPQKIGQKAVEKGLVSPDALAQMSDAEVQYLIFAAGFSTADQISKISGRGVGMDVVKTNIEKIGGQVELISTEGKGSAIRLKIPLTLAIVPALIVKAGLDRFAIPQVKLVELVRVETDRPDNGIENLQGKLVYRLRGNLLPLVTLNEVLKTDDATRGRQDCVNIVVLDANPGWFGLIVDSIEDSTDIVVKPLSSFMKSLSLYSGATVMGDGSVALTLDVVGLANHVHIFEEKPEATQKIEVGNNRGISGGDIAEYILVEVGAPGKYAIPLVLVNRLEVFQRSEIESAGGRRVVQYRNTILPLLGVSERLHLPFERKNHEAETVPVVVVSRGGKYYGLVVERILDVVSTEAEIDSNVKDREGILGSMICQDEVIVVLDAYHFINDAIPAAASATKATLESAQNIGKDRVKSRGQFHILLAEDNGFYRKHVQRLLTDAGYRVTANVNGQEAYQQLLNAKDGSFNLLLSDIEMPVMTGWELAKEVRKNERFMNIPMVALTTRFSQADRDLGRQVGFSRYLEKINPDQLIQELDQTLGIKED